MKLINQTWNAFQEKYDNTWLADTESDIPSNHDTESAVGSVILVIFPQVMYMKNTAGKWQKMGTTEVLS